MDAGQSGVRVRIGATILPELPGVRTGHPVVPQLAEAARQAIVLAGATVGRLAIGSTGLRGTASASELLDLVADSGISRVALAHDSLTSHLGALGGQRGVVVAAGTGCVTFAVGATGVARVDGWGNIVGDAGSGFWIGRAGFDAVLRAHDGRGPATALAEIVMADFPDIEAAYLDIQNDPGYVSRVAAYAKVVAELADTDPVCAGIIDAAADELANSAVVALRRVGEDQCPSTMVGTIGKVFLSARLRSRFADLVQAVIPGAVLTTPLGDALDGASQLFNLPADSPLRAHVSYA